MTAPTMFFWNSSAWTFQRQLPTAIHFRKFLQKISVVESFFWSNYRLAVHKECFPGNLPKAFGAPKYLR